MPRSDEMKQLILIRHAKSSWKDPNLEDRRRPLNKRGTKDAPRMGARLARRGIVPDAIISSPAARAFETAQIIAKKLGYRRKKIVVDERVYGASVADLLDVIRGVDDAAVQLMVFGHNPELTELANRLGTRAIDNIPTCGVLELGFATDTWQEVGDVAGKELLFEYPKNET